MNPDLVKIIGITVGTIVSLPISYFTFKGGRFFGEMSRALRTMEASIATLTAAVDKHDTRITRIETARETEERFARRHHARRSGDPPPDDEREAH